MKLQAWNILKWYDINNRGFPSQNILVSVIEVNQHPSCDLQSISENKYRYFKGTFLENYMCTKCFGILYYGSKGENLFLLRIIISLSFSLSLSSSCCHCVVFVGLLSLSFMPLCHCHWELRFLENSICTKCFGTLWHGLLWIKRCKQWPLVVENHNQAQVDARYLCTFCQTPLISHPTRTSTTLGSYIQWLCLALWRI